MKGTAQTIPCCQAPLSTVTGIPAQGEAPYKITILVAAILLLGFICTAFAAYHAAGQVQRLARARFELLSERLTSETQRRANQPVEGLKGLLGLYAACRSVSRHEFSAYVNTVDPPKRIPGVLGFGFIQHVTRADLDAFIAAARADGDAGFAVHSNLSGPMALSHASDLYVVKYIYPKEGTGPAWGYDIGSDPMQRAAIELAVQTGEPIITGRTRLHLDDQKHAGFRYFLPLYKKGPAPKTAEEREAALEGLIYAPIILDLALSDTVVAVEGYLDFEVFDVQKLRRTICCSITMVTWPRPPRASVTLLMNSGCSIRGRRSRSAAAPGRWLPAPRRSSRQQMAVRCQA